VTNSVVVLCTCASEGEGERLARALVDERLAACVNLLPAVHSIYRWNDAIEEAHEYLLLIKSAESLFPLVRDRIIALHSYETPEIIAVPIVAGSEQYLNWLRGQL
jgi:periplasmic divalent cation tolerance protein